VTAEEGYATNHAANRNIEQEIPTEVLEKMLDLTGIEPVTSSLRILPADSPRVSKFEDNSRDSMNLHRNSRPCDD
jgi:hypothetical protein